MKFLCDQMLGTLAKWLRIYGFDTFYSNDNLNDKKLLKISLKENRTLLTRDKNLVYCSRRENVKVIYILDIDVNKQLKQVLKNIKKDNNLFLSRCLICNSLVKKIGKNDIKNKVPERVFSSNEDFWFCKKCDKIYWKGSHFKNMKQKINNL